jgi:large subunit ribosomal protein L37Ae
MFKSCLRIGYQAGFKHAQKYMLSGMGLSRYFWHVMELVKIVAKEKSFGSIKRFGARYGRTTKYKLSKIEAELKKKHKCPYCRSLAAKRIAAGIWRCKKCKSKFTGKAYSTAKRIAVRKKVEEQPAEIEEMTNREEGEKYGESSEEMIEERKEAKKSEGEEE